MDETMKENKELSKEAKVLLLKILKQGYLTPEQVKEMTATIGLPMIQVEVIDKTSSLG